MTARMFMPLSQVLSWPAAQFKWPDTPSLDEVGLIEYGIQDSGGVLAATATFYFATELAFGIPGLEGFELAVLAGDGGTELQIEIDLTGTFAIRLVDLSVALRE